MKSIINKCQAEETAACCCVDVGNVMDNRDCSAQWVEIYTDRAAADQAIEKLTQRARAVESSPCVIEMRCENVEEGIKVTMDFNFCCQAESLIFQLGLR